MVVDGCDEGPVPRALVAFTVHVYDLPGVNPLTVTGPVRADFERVTPPLLDVHVAVYFVIGEPLFRGAPNPTFTTPLATAKHAPPSPRPAPQPSPKKTSPTADLPPTRSPQ